jgi:hypothetical protein
MSVVAASGVLALAWVARASANAVVERVVSAVSVHAWAVVSVASSA